MLPEDEPLDTKGLATTKGLCIAKMLIQPISKVVMSKRTSACVFESNILRYVQKSRYIFFAVAAVVA